MGLCEARSMSLSGQQWFRLEFTAVSRRRSNGPAGYGFVLFEDDTGILVATGGGAVGSAVTYPQAIHIALHEGLKVAVNKGARRVLLHCDSNPALRQVLRTSRSTTSCGPLEAARDILRQQMTEYRALKVDRWANGLALMQGEFAAELHEVLLKVAAAPPSKYMSVSGQLGMLLQLPISAKRWLEGADDFRDAAAEVVAVRCGANKDDVMATMNNKHHINTAYTTINSSTQQPPAELTAQESAVQPTGAAVEPTAADYQYFNPPVCFRIQRSFTAEEGAAYAAAAAVKAETAVAGHTAVKEMTAESTEDGLPSDDDDDDDDVELSTLHSSRSSRSTKGNRLEFGRVIGRHRMTHARLLVVGLHNLPQGFGQPALPEAQQQQQQQQQPQEEGKGAPLSISDCSQQHQRVTGMESPSSSPPAAAAAAAATDAGAPTATSPPSVPGTVLLGDDLLPYWLGRQRAGGAETIGLGSARYQLPQVASDAATHLLQFDGASRNNPGRGGYGYIIFDLTSSQVVNRGCMTLPYGMTAGKAEFEGLNAGLQAAVDAGIRRLAVQGDSNLVLDSMMYKRGRESKFLAVAYQRACQLLTNFDHVDFQWVPRQQNTLADRLANISLDMDTAIYALLRKGIRDESAATGATGISDRDALRALVKAAKISKNQGVLDLLLESFEFPLLMCVLLNRVMALTPEQLLVRLENKAAHMGDPNPALVQEVRKVVSTGVPADLMQHVGAAMMDSRYSRMDLIKLRKEAALVRSNHPQLQGFVHQQQQPQRTQVGQVRHYNQSAAAGSCASDGWQQMQQLPLPWHLATRRQQELKQLERLLQQQQQQQQTKCNSSSSSSDCDRSSTRAVQGVHDVVRWSAATAISSSRVLRRALLVCRRCR